MTATPTPLRELLAEARREFRDSDAAGDVLDWLEERAALSAAGALWCLHIEGPDEVHAAPSREHAQKAADLFNATFVGSDPRMHAKAAPWPHSAASHAEDVGDFIATWLLPRWQVDAMRRPQCVPDAWAVRDREDGKLWSFSNSRQHAERTAKSCGDGLVPLFATPPAASGDDVGYSSADALNPNLRVLRQIAVKMPPSWEREALFHAELDLGMQIRRLAAVAPAGMVLMSEPERKALAGVMADAEHDAGDVDDIAPRIEDDEDAYWAFHRYHGLRKLLTATPTPPATAGQEEWEVCRHLGMENEWSDWAPCPPHLVEQLKTSSSHRLRKKVGRG